MNIIPIHLYANKKLCVLSYNKIDYLPFINTFYVISPNSLPLPKHVQMYYTLVSNQYPFNLLSIHKFRDPYDLTNIYKLSEKLKDKKLGVIFGLPLKNNKYTTKLYETQQPKSVVLTTDKNTNKNYNFLKEPTYEHIVTLGKNMQKTKYQSIFFIFFTIIIFIISILLCVNFINPIFT